MYLYSINSDVQAYVDKSKSQNIINSELTIIDTIAVQNTCNNNYVREIVTGCIIPISERSIYFDYANNYTHCVFVLRKGHYNSKKLIFYPDTIHECSSAELEQYIKDHFHFPNSSFFGFWETKSRHW